MSRASKLTLFKMFKTKIVRFEANIGDSLKLDEEFDRIDDYFENITKYILNDIYIDYEKDDVRFFQSRVQSLLSNTLLRLLMLKEGIVSLLNENNLASAIPVVKAFMETTAVLGYLFDLAERNLGSDEMLACLNRLAMGEKGGNGIAISKV